MSHVATRLPKPPKITVLVDDKASSGLQAEHGFSAWVETTGQTILFDTGQGSALAHNASVLGIALHTADALVLSHGHYDHTGGVPTIIERAPAIDVYCHPTAPNVRYSIRDGKAKPVDMPGPTRAAFSGLVPDRTHWITEPIHLSAQVGLTGFIPRHTDYEDTGGPFFVDAAGNQSDPIADDLALWMRTPRGVVVLVGCSHAGLVNTLHQVLRLSRESRIHAVVGGFHLLEATTSRIARTADALRELGLDLIVPCHCTGDRAIETLARVLGERVVTGAAGASYAFAQGGPEKLYAEAASA